MLNEIWITVFTLIKSIVGDVDVKNKGTLQKQIDDCFQSASDGKSAIASAITGKGVSTDADATFAQMAANIGSIKTNPRLQAKNAALSTAAQAIKPDSGYDGLSQVAIPAVTGNAAQGDVLSGRTFNSATAGIAKAGTLADKTGTADYSAAASLDSTNGRIKLQVPAVGKYGTGNYLYAAFATIASLIGLTASKLVKGCTILGITGNSANVDTSAGNAAASQILSGKKAYVGGNLVTGSMSDKSGTTVTAGSVTQDSSYTYFGVPSSGYYSTGSKLRALNSNIGTGLKPTAVAGSNIYSKGMTLKAGNFYLIEARCFGTNKPSIEITYGSTSNIHEIFKSYKQPNYNTVYTAYVFALIYVSSDTTLTITHKNYGGTASSYVMLVK